MKPISHPLQQDRGIPKEEPPLKPQVHSPGSLCPTMWASPQETEPEVSPGTLLLKVKKGKRSLSLAGLGLRARPPANSQAQGPHAHRKGHTSCALPPTSQQPYEPCAASPASRTRKLKCRWVPLSKESDKTSDKRWQSYSLHSPPHVPAYHMMTSIIFWGESKGKEKDCIYLKLIYVSLHLLVLMTPNSL